MKKKWNYEKLELLRLLTNKQFPKNPIKSVETIKRILIRESKLRNEPINYN